MQTMSTPHALAESIAPKVAILMGTFNGEQFLPEQLDSIRQQTHANWELHVSDDGSTDNTLNAIKTTSAQWSDYQVTLRRGPQKGFVANFLSLVCDVDIQADYYAFSDQDDVWELDKLERALRWLKTIPSDKPAMYCSRTRLIDESGQHIGFSPLFKRKPSFKNALVQSIAGANTMVFNEAARKSLLRSGYQTPIVSHDWWVYMLVTGCNGTVFFDPMPTVRYRQHGGNIVGSNVGWKARRARVKASLKGRFANWNDINLNALLDAQHVLSSNNQQSVGEFLQLRKATVFRRLKGLVTSRLYRQTLYGNMSLYIAAIMRKI